MKRPTKSSDDADAIRHSSPRSLNLCSRDTGEKKYESNPMKLIGIFVISLMVISVLFSLSVVLRDPPSNGVPVFAESRALRIDSNKGTDIEEDFSQSVEPPKDELLGGLLVPGFEEKSCFSRYQAAFYRKKGPYEPSPYLISRLRNYEALHKRCGPNTESYNRSLEQLSSGNYTGGSDCNYVVWISFSGLGNRMLTIASAFLYSLLTNRVLLIDRGVDMTDLFCEPFPDVSWLLPSDFPLASQFKRFDQNSPHSYGNKLKNNSLENLSSSPFPPFVYLHLAHDYDDRDKLFFCNEDQSFLRKVPWLVMKTDNYFVPSLYLIPSFEQELFNLFPQKETIFHFLGRYLFHPSNPVWGLITRYYGAYLAKSDEKIGIQIRVFEVGTGPFQHVLDQILACATKQNLLPEINVQESLTSPLKNKRSKAVLITSLSSGYFERIRNMYWEHPTVTGEFIGVYQPSSEEFQQSGKLLHNRKAWAEMYLLSLTDVLVTSAWSTFGYVAQGLGGLKPWIMFKPENRTVPDPPCRRVMSMEPCFHAPPFYDCKAKKGVDTGAILPHVRHCEDMSWGLKLVDHSE